MKLIKSYEQSIKRHKKSIERYKKLRLFSIVFAIVILISLWSLIGLMTNDPSSKLLIFFGIRFGSDVDKYSLFVLTSVAMTIILIIAEQLIVRMFDRSIKKYEMSLQEEKLSKKIMKKVKLK